MTNKEAREVLIAYRPNRPQKLSHKKLQQAIDVALETMDAYDNLLKAISVEVRGSQK